MAKIIILGNLAADAEVKTANRAGKATEFVTFRMAENEKRGDESVTTYYDVTMGKTGVLEYLKKGQKVLVFGGCRFTIGEGKDGKNYPNISVNAFSVELVGKKAE